MDDLYRSELMEVYKDPAHRGELSDPSVFQEKHNPFCGDHLQLQLQVESGVIKNARWQGEMCFVSIVGAEFLLEEIIGKSLEAVKQIDQKKLLSLLDLNLSTSRIACATLTLKALQEALVKYDN